MSTTITGSCLCKALQYTINREVVTAANCHCDTCKKSTGAAFETVAVARQKSLKINAGADGLKTYRIGDKAVKHFCGHCGTPLYNTHKNYPGFVMVHIGSLDEPHRIAPGANFFCGRMLPWVGTIADLESHDRLREK